MPTLASRLLQNSILGRDRESGQKQRSPDLAELSCKIRGIEDGTLLNGRLSYGTTVIS